MLSRRSWLGSLASLPLIGFLFGDSTNAKSIKNYGTPLKPFSEMESVTLDSGIRFPTLHIPNEDGSITCIPLTKKDFTLSVYNKVFLEDGKGNILDCLNINVQELLEVKDGKIVNFAFTKIPSEIPPILNNGPILA